MNLYHCYTIWATNTQAQRITDTVAWLPSKIPMPTTSSIDYILAGITDIVHALQHPSPNLPLAPLSDSKTKALQLLMLILHGTTNPNQPTMAPAPSLRVAYNPTVKSPTKSLDPPISNAPTASLQVEQPTPHPNDATVPMDNCTTCCLHPPSTIATKPLTHNWHQPWHSPCLSTLHANQCHPVDPVQHTTLHGNVFNPNTGELTK